MMNSHIVDLHMHIVPGIDDGSRSIEETLQLLKLSAEQGVSDVFCTSHNGYCEEDGIKYAEAYRELKSILEETDIPIRIHKGCEVLCASDYIDDIIYGLDAGIFQTLGKTKYVLTELYSDAKPSEAVYIIKKLQESGYKPIIAHMERNYNITGLIVGMLIKCGAMIQVNAISLTDEADLDIRERARELLRNKYIHFIGSDAHRINHRPPCLKSGVQYIIDNADEEYAVSILNGNAQRILT